MITLRGRGARDPTIKRYAAFCCLLTAAALAVSACATSSEQAATSAQSASPCPQDSGPRIAGFPDERLDCLTGPGRMRISVTHGRPEVVNVWASWCAPCRQEIVLLERLHHRLGSRVLFVGVDEKDRPAPALSLLADRRVSYPQVADPDGSFARGMGLAGVPDTIAVDAAGRVVYRYQGQLTADALHDLLRALGSPPRR